jgi:hypothetical protein
MTSDQLRKVFNDKFGLNDWPTQYEVDAETYGHCCQAVFDHKDSVVSIRTLTSGPEEEAIIVVSLGSNKGLLFSNVELIIKKE